MTQNEKDVKEEEEVLNAKSRRGRGERYGSCTTHCYGPPWVRWLVKSRRGGGERTGVRVQE